MRVLFVASEVAPFSTTTQTSWLARHLPEQLEEQHGVEPRILMPRYGSVSERRNRLHEVIRLSGSEIAVGEASDTLKVKVASIPGIRLQVYFMDSAEFFKPRGVVRVKKTGELIERNAERAAFFARAVLDTVGNLRWVPDVVHAIGWAAGLVPAALRQSDAEAFAAAKVVYTPDDEAETIAVPEALAAELGQPDLAGLDVREAGARLADAVLFPDGAGLTEDSDAEAAQAAAAEAHAQYEALTSDVAA